MAVKKYKMVDRKVADLIPYVNNSRIHSDEQVIQICSSIKEFGFTNPVLIDEENGVIAGHGRLIAAKKMAMEKVPCLILAGLSEAQKKAYVIADNAIALNSSWNMEKLAIEVEALETDDFDLNILGFSDNELADLSMGWDSDIVPAQQSSEKQGEEQTFKVVLTCDNEERENLIEAVNALQDIKGLKIDYS